MSQQSVSLFYDLLQSPAFVAAFKEFVEAETGSRVERLRAAVRQNQTAAALLVEGELAAIEELPALFAQYAEQGTPHRL